MSVLHHDLPAFSSAALKLLDRFEWAEEYFLAYMDKCIKKSPAKEIALKSVRNKIIGSPILRARNASVSLKKLPRVRRMSDYQVISGVEIKDLASAVFLVSKYGAYASLPGEYKKEKAVALAAVSKFPHVIRDIVDELKYDRGVVLPYLHSTEQLTDSYSIDDYKIASELMCDLEILALWELKRYKIFPTFMNTQSWCVPKRDETKDPFVVNTKLEQRHDKAFLLQMFAFGKCLLVNLPIPMQKDSDIILAAIRQRAKTIHQVPKECINEVLLYNGIAANPLLLFEVPNLIEKEFVEYDYLQLFGSSIVTKILIYCSRVNIVKMLSVLRSGIVVKFSSRNLPIIYEILKLLVQAMNLITTSIIQSVHNWKLLYHSLELTPAMHEILNKVAKSYLLPIAKGRWPELDRMKDVSQEKIDYIFQYVSLNRLSLFVNGGDVKDHVARSVNVNL